MFFNVHLNLKVEHLRSSTDSLQKHGGRNFNPRPAVWQNTAASEPLLLELAAHFFICKKSTRVPSAVLQLALGSWKKWKPSLNLTLAWCNILKKRPQGTKHSLYITVNCFLYPGQNHATRFFPYRSPITEENLEKIRVQLGMTYFSFCARNITIFMFWDI